MKYKCKICKNELLDNVSWTDTHGVAQCTNCGTPYQILFYDDENRRIKGKAPLCLRDPRSIEYFIQYWEETKSIAQSGCSFPGGYELATPEEIKKLYDWWDKNNINQKIESA